MYNSFNTNAEQNLRNAIYSANIELLTKAKNDGASQFSEAIASAVYASPILINDPNQQEKIVELLVSWGGDVNIAMRSMICMGYVDAMIRLKQISVKNNWDIKCSIKDTITCNVFGKNNMQSMIKLVRSWGARDYREAVLYLLDEPGVLRTLIEMNDNEEIKDELSIDYRFLLTLAAQSLNLKAMNLLKELGKIEVYETTRFMYGPMEALGTASIGQHNSNLNISYFRSCLQLLRSCGFKCNSLTFQARSGAIQMMDLMRECIIQDTGNDLTIDMIKDTLTSAAVCNETMTMKHLRDFYIDKRDRYSFDYESVRKNIYRYGIPGLAKDAEKLLMRWTNEPHDRIQHTFILDYAIALFPLNLPVHVLLELLDLIYPMFEIKDSLSLIRKVALIQGVRNTFVKIYGGII